MKKFDFTSYKKNLILLFLPLYLLISCISADFSRMEAQTPTSTTVYQVKNGSIKAVDNYFYDAIGPAGRVVRWSKNPISFYIPENDYAKTVESAFDEWEKASGQTVIFKKTDSKSNADIQVIFTEKIGSNLGGLTKTYHQKNNLIKAEIFLIEKNKNKTPLEKSKMYMLAIHEIGHSLGIVGHSSNMQDIMSTGDIIQLQGVSSNDINTLKLIYSDNSAQLKPLKTELAKKLLEQEQKVKNDPNNKIQLLTLAGMYKNINQHSKAIKTYEKVIKIDPDCAQAFYSIGVCYYKKGQMLKSIEFFNQAVDKEPDNFIFLQTFIKISCETNNKNMAEKYLVKYIEKHPESKDDPIINEYFNELNK